MTEVRCPLWEAAEISRDEIAFVTSQGSMKFYEAGQIVAATAERLGRVGWNRGDRIAVWMPTDWRTVILAMAMWRRGLVLCPLDPGLPASQIADRLIQVSAAALVTVDPSTVPEGIECPVYGAADLVVMFNAAGEGEAPGYMLDLQAPATILFTSGSSGGSRAVMHTVANHYYNALGSNQNLRIRSKDAWLLSLPLHHVAGLGVLWRCALAGAGVVVSDAGEDLMDALYLYDPTHVSMVATQLQRFLAGRDAWKDPRKLRAILVGGGPVPAHLVKEAQEAGIQIFVTYGLTEMASQVATTPFDAPPAKRGLCGRVLRYRELRTAEDGEIQVRGRTCFAGYVDGDVVTRPFDAEGWFSTGDLGAVDEEGYLTVLGRKDNMFISGGENIYPEEIELALCNLPGVEESIVVPVDDREFGRRPLAFVRSQGAAAAPDEMREALRSVLPSFKVPDEIRPWPEGVEKNGLKPDRSLFMRLVSKAT